MKKILILTLSLLTINLVSKAQVELTSTSVGATYYVTVPGTFVLTPGLQVTFKANVDNSASMSLDVSGTGAKPIRKLGGSQPLSGSDILSNQIVTVAYDGSNWQMISAIGSTPTAPTNYWSPNGLDIFNNNTGNVGIGTTPSSKLDVSSTSYSLLQLSTTGANSNVNIDINTTGAGTAQFSQYGGTGGFTFATQGTLPTPAMSIIDNGNVGIGTTAPAQKLEIQDGHILLSNTGTQSELRFKEASANGGNIISFKAPAALVANVQYTLPINVGAANDVLSSSDGTGTLSWASVSSLANAWGLGGNAVASIQTLGTTTNFDLPFITNNTERMRLNSGGTQFYPSVDNTLSLGSVANSWKDVYADGYLYINGERWTSLSATNTLIGTRGNQSFTSGNYNVGVGYGSGNAITTGFRNTFVGHRAGELLTTSSDNTLIGNLTGGLTNALGDNNTLIGSYAGYGVSNSGASNTYVGAYSGGNNTTGNSNAFLGYNSGLNNTTGYFNTFIGAASGQVNLVGNLNTFTGYLSGNSNTGDNNTFNGYASGRGTTSGGYNAFFGTAAGFTNTTGTGNSYYGGTVGYNNNGSYNTFMGYGTAYNATSGDYNTLIGSDAGGAVALLGTFNTYLGYGAKGTASLTNATAIGKNANVTASNSIVLGGTGADAVKVGIGTTAPSTTLDVANSTIVTTSRFMNTFNGASNTAVYGGATGASAGGTNYGGSFNATGSTGNNYAVYGYASGNSGAKTGVYGGAVGTGTNIGGYFSASGGTTNNALQLVDGSQANNRVLTSNATGVATWTDLSAISSGSTAWTRSTPNIYPTTLTDNVGIGVATPTNKLDVEGAAVIGATFSGTSTAPTNGLLVEGTVGIGTPSPGTYGLYSAVGTSTNKKTLTVSAFGASFVDNAPAVLEIRGGTNTVGAEVGVIDFINTSNGSIDYNFARISAHRENANATFSSLRFYTRTGATLNEAMRINENGKIGIGITDPIEILEIGSIDSDIELETYSATESSSLHIKRGRGTLAVPTIPSSGDYYGGVGFQAWDGTVFQEGARIQGVVDGVVGATDMPGRLEFWTSPDGSAAAVERMRITNSGNVGIGITPSYKLHVENLSSSNVALFTNTTTTGGVGIRADVSLNNATGAATRTGVYGTAWYGTGINEGGHFYGYGGTTSYGIYAQAGGATTNWAGYFTVGDVYIQNTLGIGTTTPDLTMGIDVQTAAGGYIANFENTTGAVGDDGVKISIGNALPNTTAFYLGCYAAGGLDGGLRADGAGGVGLYTASDRRLKQNIIDLPDALNMLSKISAKQYEFKKAPGKTMYGFIAQDLFEIYPTAVAEPDGPDGIFMVNYASLTPLLTGGINELYKLVKEQQTQIDELRREIDVLKNK